ncbi:MAG: hypothetical protein AAF704_14435 [Cyanobacteria bacterium P01_D01_bin.123]
MNFIQGCLCLLITGSVGAVSVFFVGHVVYAIALNWAIAADQFVSNPLEGSENYGELYAFLLNSLLYLFAGLVVGVIATVQIARTSHLWSSSTWWRVRLLMLIGELATCLGVGLLLGLSTAGNAYPQLRSPNAPTTGYGLWQLFLTLGGIGLLGTYFWLPRLIGVRQRF